MTQINVQTAQPYAVKLAPLAALGAELAAIADGSALIVTDETVAPLYLAQARKSLLNAGFRVHTAAVPAGEASKNAKNYVNLLNILAEKQLTRTDTVVALGGGVVGDLAGFAAATYLRGIRLVQVPTTLLAMVDSSVGGKTAIDLRAGKNLAGAFHQPALVLCDTAALDTLPAATFRDGCAEVLKTAILFDPELFSHLAARGVGFDREWVIARCVAHKRDVVCADEFDRGQRQLLNLGHTVGHAVERCSGYRVSHGSAVAIGTAIMARAFARDADDILRALEIFGLPTETEYSTEALAQAALSDKKRHGDTLTLVVPHAVGRCELKNIAVSELPSVIEAGRRHG